MPVSDAPPPADHEAARRFLEDLTAVTPEEADALSATARRNAFWISHANDLNLVQDVLNEVGARIVSGPDAFEVWKGGLLERLESQWGASVANPGWRAELITRNLAQRAYNAGRWEQLSKSTTRPYAIFDSIDDLRRSIYCEVRDGTILPVDDPWWDTNSPQVHHACRSIVRGLSQRRVDRLGGPSQRPEIPEGADVPTGFGLRPDKAPPPVPNLNDYNGRLVEAANAKGLASPPVDN